MPKSNDSSAMKRPTNSAAASSVAYLQQRMTNRISGKAASDALKQGNNAGMLFRKEIKSATTVTDHFKALQNLRISEKGAKGDSLRQWSS